MRAVDRVEGQAEQRRPAPSTARIGSTRTTATTDERRAAMFEPMRTKVGHAAVAIGRGPHAASAASQARELGRGFEAPL